MTIILKMNKQVYIEWVVTHPSAWTERIESSDDSNAVWDDGSMCDVNCGCEMNKKPHS